VRIVVGGLSEPSVGVSFTVYSCRVEWYIIAGETGPWGRLAGGVCSWDRGGPGTAAEV